MAVTVPAPSPSRAARASLLTPDRGCVITYHSPTPEPPQASKVHTAVAHRQCLNFTDASCPGTVRPVADTAPAVMPAPASPRRRRAPAPRWAAPCPSAPASCSGPATRPPGRRTRPAGTCSTCRRSRPQTCSAPRPVAAAPCAGRRRRELVRRCQLAVDRRADALGGEGVAARADLVLRGRVLRLVLEPRLDRRRRAVEDREVSPRGDSGMTTLSQKWCLERAGERRLIRRRDRPPLTACRRLGTDRPQQLLVHEQARPAARPNDTASRHSCAASGSAFAEI